MPKFKAEISLSEEFEEVEGEKHYERERMDVSIQRHAETLAGAWRKALTDLLKIGELIGVGPEEDE